MCKAYWEGYSRCEKSSLANWRTAVAVLNGTDKQHFTAAHAQGVVEIVRTAYGKPDREKAIDMLLQKTDPNGTLFSPEDRMVIHSAADEYFNSQDKLTETANAIKKNATDGVPQEKKDTLNDAYGESYRKLKSTVGNIAIGCDANQVSSMEADYRKLAKATGGVEDEHESPFKPTRKAPTGPSPLSVKKTAPAAKREGNKGYGNAGKNGVVIEPGDFAAKIGWNESERGYLRYKVHEHAIRKAFENGWTGAQLAEAAHNPTVTYDNGRYANQIRAIRGDIVAIVDTEDGSIVTCYKNVTETKLRSDQKDADAIAYGRRTGQLRR